METPSFEGLPFLVCSPFMRVWWSSGLLERDVSEIADVAQLVRDDVSFFEDRAGHVGVRVTGIGGLVIDELHGDD